MSPLPGCRLEALGYRHIVELARVGGLADANCPVEARALAGFFADGAILVPELSLTSAVRYHPVISLHPEGTLKGTRRCCAG